MINVQISAYKFELLSLKFAEPKYYFVSIAIKIDKLY